MKLFILLLLLTSCATNVTKIQSNRNLTKVCYDLDCEITKKDMENR